jgi:hypothetical protein
MARMVSANSAMHVLFIHQNFPAQFGHIASYLRKKHGFRCTFVSQHRPGHGDGIERVQYHLQGGATEKCGLNETLPHSQFFFAEFACRLRIVSRRSLFMGCLLCPNVTSLSPP